MRYEDLNTEQRKQYDNIKLGGPLNFFKNIFSRILAFLNPFNAFNPSRINFNKLIDAKKKTIEEDRKNIAGLEELAKTGIEFQANNIPNATNAPEIHGSLDDALDGYSPDEKIKIALYLSRNDKNVKNNQVKNFISEVFKIKNHKPLHLNTLVKGYIDNLDQYTTINRPDEIKRAYEQLDCEKYFDGMDVNDLVAASIDLGHINLNISKDKNAFLNYRSAFQHQYNTLNKNDVLITKYKNEALDENKSSGSDPQFYQLIKNMDEENALELIDKLYDKMGDKVFKNICGPRRRGNILDDIIQDPFFSSIKVWDKLRKMGMQTADSGQIHSFLHHENLPQLANNTEEFERELREKLTINDDLMKGKKEFWKEVADYEKNAQKMDTNSSIATTDHATDSSDSEASFGTCHSSGNNSIPSGLLKRHLNNVSPLTTEGSESGRVSPLTSGSDSDDPEKEPGLKP